MFFFYFFPLLGHSFIGSYFLIPAVISQTFNPIAELIISIRITSKEAKAEIEIHPVTIHAKIKKCSI